MKTTPEADLKQMAAVAREMVDLVYQGFMENDIDYLNSVLNKERIVDDLEREITAKALELSKGLDKKERRALVLLTQSAQNIERIGDELRSLIERIEIKIAEKLFFSEIALKQYAEVFSTMRRSLEMAIEFINQGKPEILDSILENGLKIKELVERYRIEHIERVTQGICQPRAANMYFGMLDFTGNIARHCTNIARSYKRNDSKSI